MSRAKSALVTGGASGIGLGAVELLTEAGWAVTIADRDEAGGAAAARLAAGGAQVRFVRTDVTDEASVRTAVDTAVAAFGGLNAAINSAGVEQGGKPIHELDAAAWDFCVGVNLRGMFFCLKHEVRAMLAGGGGAIVAVSSAAAVKGLFHSADYCASKAGVLGLVRAAAIDCAELGIRVNALLPGATATPLARRSSAANPKLAGTLRIPVGRMAAPREIAAAAVWLISDAASYVTGASVSADGGMAIA